MQAYPIYKDLFLRDVAPPHPGEVLREDILPELGLTRAALAKRLGISPRRLTGLLAEQAQITADLAVRLGTVLGQGPRYWLGLQMQRDVWLASQPTDLPLTPVKWVRPMKAHLKPHPKAPVAAKAAPSRAMGYR